MNLCFATAGSGELEGWGERLQHRLAVLHPDVPCHIINPPGWCELGISPGLWAFEVLPQYDYIFWIDADTFPTKPLFDKPEDVCAELEYFAAVLDCPETCNLAPIDWPGCTERYFNLGVWIAQRKVAPIFSECRRLCALPGRQPRWKDQSHLNMLMPQWMPLPHGYNYIPGKSAETQDIHIIHFAGHPPAQRAAALKNIYCQ